VDRLPIIYIRGYAGPTAGIDAQVDDPFYGFNQGATHVRVDETAQPKFYQFEGPMLRLIMDHDYELLVHGDQHAYLQSRKPASVAPNSIWVYRFYDQAATTFAAPPHPGIPERLWPFRDIKEHVTARGFNIETAAKGLLDLIDLLREKINNGDKRVILVAHSMGGLVARCMMQKLAVDHDRKPKDLVAKFFTYGTPHGGIVFDTGLLNWFEEFVGPAGSEIFSPPKMYGYLTPGKKFGEEPKKGAGWDPQVIPDDVLATDNIFCLIGTDSKDYGISRKVVGPRSDGLVRIEHAYVRKAHRAFVSKAHSGRYGEVNSEEGYQNLRRFLFGRWKVAVDLVGLPTDLIAKYEKDPNPPIWQADVRLAIRSLSVLLSEQRTDQYNPIQLNDELKRLTDTPDHPVPLATVFLLDLTTAPHDPPTREEEVAANHDGITRYSLTLRVVKLKERDNFFDFGDHLEQVFDWADSAIFDVGPDESGKGLRVWANWNIDIPGALDDFHPEKSQPQRAVTKLPSGQWQFDLELPTLAQALEVFGANAKLRITITDRRPTVR
jgi:pimeloyl-ACP methyl ester carboxylesterase